MPVVVLDVDPALEFLLPRERRGGRFAVDVPPTDTVGHVVQMVGIPLTEVGSLRLDGRAVPPSVRYADPSPPARVPVIAVGPRPRPQATRHRPPRFLLDVHLGSLTRRLRLLGLDAAYEPEADDGDLVVRAVAEGRVLLTRDRALLFRSALTEGALVRGSQTAVQLADVLDRFAPALAPWTRCVRCNARLEPVAAEDVAEELEAGTRRTYRVFSRCTGCGRVYWRGAHAGPLEAVVREAERVVRARLMANFSLSTWLGR